MKNLKPLLMGLIVFSLVGCHTRGCIIADEHYDSLSGRDAKKQSASVTNKGEKILEIIKPREGQSISNPVEFCFELRGGYTLEPAKNGDNEGKGHHHVIVDVPLPPESELNQPMGKDANRLHLGNGEKCKKLRLDPGVHTVRGMLSYGSHIPYVPVITDVTHFFVE
jgi:hypothetical protein